MQQFFQSDFLQALGRAILNSIWQMALLFLVFQLVVFLFAVKQSWIKNFFASLFVFAGLGWFLLTFVTEAGSVPQKLSVVIDDSSNPALFNTLAKNNQWQLLLNWIDYKLHFILPYLSFAYIIFLSWFLLKFSVQLKAVRELRKKGLLNVDEELQSFFQLLAGAMGIGKQVKIYISTEVDIPSAVGFLKPLVLLPAATVNHLTPAQLEAVLLHELAHIKRNDYFWNMLLTVTETILFFNPFAQLLIGIARRERENSCDDYVMSYQANAAVYAEALLNVEKVRLLQPQLVMGLGDTKYHLMDRVKRILNVPAEKNKISSRILALVLVTFIFTLTGWIISNRQQKKNHAAITSKIRTPFTAGTLVLTPDVTVQKNKKLIQLKDEKRKLNIELKRDEVNENEYFIWNETDEKELKVDNIVFEDLPFEWLEHRNGKTNHSADMEQQVFTEEPISIYQKDSLRKRITEKWRAAVTEQKIMRRKNERKQPGNFIFTYNRPGLLPAQWENDSLLNPAYKIFEKGLNLKEFYKFTHPGYEKVIENFYRSKDEAECKCPAETQKRRVAVRTIKNRDSLHKKINESLLPLIAFEKMKALSAEEELMAGENVIELIIKERMPYFNEKQFTVIMRDSAQTQHPSAPPRRIKHMEIIRL